MNTVPSAVLLGDDLLTKPRPRVSEEGYLEQQSQH